MSQVMVKEVMESMGWTDGSYIPMANKENKQLMESISSLLSEKNQRSTFLHDVDERTNKLTSHCKNAEQDIEQNNKLLTAHRSQYTSEGHMLKIAEREESKMRQILKELEKEGEEKQKHEENIEKETKRLTKSIEHLSSKIQWAKSTLQEWNKAMAKEAETNAMIEKFCKEDQHRAFELETKRKGLVDAIFKQRKILIDGYEEQKSLEQALDRTAQLYRQAHEERLSLINTWKNAVKQMNLREADIHKCEKEIENTKLSTVQKLEELTKQNERLEKLKEENAEINENIEETNRELCSCREQMLALSEQVTLKEIEVNIAQKDFQALLQSINEARHESRRKMQDKETKEQEIIKLEEEIQILEERLRKFSDQNSNAQERLIQLEDLIQSNEKAQRLLSTEITRLNGILFRSQEQLRNMQNEQKVLENGNDSIENDILSLKRSIKEASNNLQKAIEVCYENGFRIETLESNIDKLTNIESEEDPEKEILYKSLQHRKEAVSKDVIMMERQVVEIEEETAKLTFLYNKDAKELEELNRQLKELQMLCEGGEKQYKQELQNNQERIVELSVLKMRVYDMETQIAKQEEKSFSLDKHKAEIEKMMNERFINIQAQLEALFLKKKHLNEERSVLRADLGERQIKIDAWKKRYELAVELLGRNEDGSIVTATQLKVEAAQEKQLLLQEGTELNEKVIKAENEIKAMENTLCLLNFSNDSYRKTFEKLDEDNPDLIELQNYQENYCNALTKLKQIKSSINQKIQQIEDFNHRKAHLEKALEDINRIRMDRKETLMKIYKELVDQKAKIKRAEKELKMAMKSARQKNIGEEYEKIFEKDLNLRELEERNRMGLQLLADLMDTNFELAPEVSKILFEKGLKLPQARRSRSRMSFCSEYSELSTSERGASASAIGTLGSAAKESAATSSRSTISSIGSSSHEKFSPSVVSIDFQADDKKLKSSKRSAKSKISKGKE